MTLKHDWPKNGLDYRRFRFDNPRRAVANGESYMRDFNCWLIDELHGLLPDIVAKDRIEVRPSAHTRADYNLPEVLIRWHVCVEVDEFLGMSAEDQVTLNRLLHFLGLKSVPTAIEPLRVLRYYSFSPRQYDRLLELMGTEQ